MLRVHLEVEPAVLVTFKGRHLFPHDLVKGELIVAGVHAGC